MSVDSTADPVQQRIQQIVNDHEVVLFMKGKRAFPQCGFSATVVGMLDELVDSYETVNVLADPDIRSGIKAFSDWPTIPQLYIKGEFVGGCDITKDLYASGELHTLLGATVEEVAPPTISVTEAAAKVIKEAGASEQHPALRLEISSRFQYNLGFAPQGPGDLVVEAGGLTFLFDRGSAKRADGLSIDYVADAGGFRIDNPNEPATVKQISVAELKTLLEADSALKLYDVRGDQERAIAVIPGSVQWTPDVAAEVQKLAKDTPLYFTCHSGRRSQAAAQELLQSGFKNVHNVQGGIEAWSQHVDPSVPRY